MRIAVAQVPDVVADVEGALRTIVRFASAAAQNRADIVVFPEAYLQGYTTSDEHLRQHSLALDSKLFAKVGGALKDLGPALVLGIIERDGTEYFNSAIVLKRGDVLARYRKRHLLRSERTFQPGTSPAVFDIRGIRCSLAICHDLTAESTFVDAKENGASVVVAPCNNMLPLASAEKWRELHSPMRQAMAKQFGLWIAASDVSGRRGNAIALGPTQLIDPRGRAHRKVPTGETGIAYADIPAPTEPAVAPEQQQR